MTLRVLTSVSFALLVVTGISQATIEQLTAHSREAFVMGTRVVLTTYAATRAHGLQRLEQMLEVIERTDAELSTWRPDSEVSRLNAAAGGGPQRLTLAMCRLLTNVDRLVSETEGTFDPAVGSLVQVWDLHGLGRVPSGDDLDVARARSGWQRIRLDRERCTLAQPSGVLIDVGAFGKGEALDRVRTELSDAWPWLIDLGGQVAVSGVPPGGDGWPVNVAHPRARGTSAASLTMTEGSLSTSAGSERDLQVNAKRVGHILDPRTGRPAPFGGSVTVWSDSALRADVLSTALYVLGPDAGMRWAETHEVAALFLDVATNGTLQRRSSRAFAQRFGDRTVRQ